MAAPKAPTKQVPSGQQSQGGKDPQAMSKEQIAKEAEEKGKEAEKQGKAMSEEQRQREAQQAAQTAMEARKKADYYAAALAGAGDPDERQELINKKLEQEMKAETFGKTAKYIQTSGSFQGFAAGAGLGVGLGAVLGTLTGTLVGGPVGLITGGIGAGVGKLYGPFVNVAEWGGNKLRSITGDLPGWKATEDQKKALEHMCGFINDEECPSPEELESIAGDRAAEASQMYSDGKATGKEWKQNATDAWSNGKKTWSDGKKNATEAWSSATGGGDANKGQQAKVKPSPSSVPSKPKDGKSGPPKLGKPASKPASTPSKTDQPARSDSASPANETKEKKKPRKLEPRSNGTSQGTANSTGASKPASSASTPKRAPKKLETRS
jgi:hypothetical protein